MDSLQSRFSMVKVDAICRDGKALLSKEHRGMLFIAKLMGAIRLDLAC